MRPIMRYIKEFAVGLALFAGFLVVIAILGCVALALAENALYIVLAIFAVFVIHRAGKTFLDDLRKR